MKFLKDWFQTTKTLNEDDKAYAFLIGVIAVPAVLLTIKLIYRAAEYSFGGEAITEGEALLITAIGLAFWTLTRKTKEEQNDILRSAREYEFKKGGLFSVILIAGLFVFSQPIFWASIIECIQKVINL